MSANAVRWKQCTGVAQRTISSAAVSGRSRLNKLPLIGVFEERVHAVRHGVAGGLVACDGEQDHEERELDVVEGFAVDVGLDQPGDDVVSATGGTPLASWGPTRLRGRRRSSAML